MRRAPFPTVFCFALIAVLSHAGLYDDIMKGSEASRRKRAPTTARSLRG